MERKDSIGPETPRPPHWMGDEPMRPVGDPITEQGTLPRYGAGGSVGFWQVEHPVHPGVYPVIGNDLGRDNVENDLPDADQQDLQERT